MKTFVQRLMDCGEDDTKWRAGKTILELEEKNTQLCMEIMELRSAITTLPAMPSFPNRDFSRIIGISSKDLAKMVQNYSEDLKIDLAKKK